MKYSNLVLLDMDLSFGLYQKSKLKYRFLEKKLVVLQKKLVWYFSLLINIVGVATYSLGEVGVDLDSGKAQIASRWKWVVSGASFLLAAYSQVLLWIWMLFKLSSEFQLRKKYDFIITQASVLQF